LGVIYAITRGIIGLLSTQIFGIEKMLGEKLSFLLVTLIYSFTFILLGMINMPVMVLFVILLYFTRDYKNALIENYIHRHVNSSQRATILSIKNLMLSIASTIYVLVGGVMLDLLSINTMLILLGFTTLVTVLPCIVWRYKT
jgi:hypothetical protein